MSPTVVAIVAIVVVAGLAMLMRRAGGGAETSGPADASQGGADGGARRAADDAGGIAVDDDPDDDDLDDEDAAPKHVLVTSEGIALATQGRTIRMIPLIRGEEVPDWLQKGMDDGAVPYSFLNEIYGFSAHPDRGPASGSVLSSGDFTAARVRRDAQGHWCLETLGRDGDFGFMPFGNEARARDAFTLLEGAGIVQHAVDENGDAVPPSVEDFEEARRRYEETERELALATDEDELPPGDYSTRR